MQYLLLSELIESKKSSRNFNESDPAKYLHPESREFEFPVPGDYKNCIDKLLGEGALIVRIPKKVQ